MEDYNFGPTGAEIREGLSYAKWRGVLEQAAAVDRAGAWCLGDCINYGEHRYGEKYAQAVSETNLSPERLRVVAWVCSRFPKAERRVGLSFESHREVASISEREERNEWLERAERGGWSSKELRNQLREAGVGNRAAGRTSYVFALTFPRPLGEDEVADLRQEINGTASEFEPDYVRFTRRNG
jgi:hypothetical protein